MLTVFPFYDGDVDRMLQLLEWIQDLGGCPKHDALLVADAGTEWQRCLEVKKLAAQSFKTVTLITNETSVMGWIEGPKSLFLAGAKWAHKQNVPFLQMETDAIPLVSGWLDKIDQRLHGLRWHLYGARVFEQRTTIPAQVSEWNSRLLPGRFKARIRHKTRCQLGSSIVELSDTGDQAHTPLIKHRWGEKDLAPTFVKRKLAAPVNAFTLDDIPKEAVIWHRNKDGTLIELLREKMGLKKEEPMVRQRPPVNRRTITVRRTAALGDVLASTVVAHKLMDLGYDVSFQAHPSAHCILRRVIPPLHAIMEPAGNPQVNLDGAYETDPKRQSKHFAEMFVERTNLQLGPQNIRIENWKNFAPRMEVTEAERRQALNVFKNHPRPWVLICPRSNTWANRTVPDRIWQAAASQMIGTKFWLGIHGPAPGGIVDLQCRHFDTAIGYLAAADLLVSTDTGPMHVAAALGTPVVAIQQSSSPELHLE